VRARASQTRRQTIRSWRWPRRSAKTLDDLSHLFNPILRGWVKYYGRYDKSELYRTFQVLDRMLVRGAMRKDKKLKGHQRRATHGLGRMARRQPRLFGHWQMGVRPAAGREEPDEPRGSRPDLRGRGGAIPSRYSTRRTLLWNKAPGRGYEARVISISCHRAETGTSLG
jgi:Group II intron, maturase-specific domain